MSSAGISGNSTGSSKIRDIPYSFSLYGLVNTGTLNHVGSDGWYWSNWATGDINAYYLHISGNYVGVSDHHDYGSGYRYRGYSVRCIAP